MKKKMKPTSLFSHYIPSPLEYLSFTLAAVTPQSGKNLSVRQPLLNHHFSDLNNFFSIEDSYSTYELPAI